MRLSKYNSFINKDVVALNESIERARKLMKNREAIKQAAKELGLLTDDLQYKMDEGEIRTLRLSDFDEEDRKELKYKTKGIKIRQEELKRLEQDKSFQKIKEMLAQNQNLGYMYNFTYMHYVEKLPLNEIEQMYNKILELKDLLPKMKKFPEIGRTFDANFIDESLPRTTTDGVKNNSELLSDGLDGLVAYKKVKKVLDELPKKIRKEYDSAPKPLKDELESVAESFYKIKDTKLESGLTLREKVWKNFFGDMQEDTNEFTRSGKPNPTYGKLVFKSKLRQYENMPNPLKALVKGAKDHLESAISKEEEYDERIKLINKVNKKLGNMGADIVMDENGIIVVNVHSFAANSTLNKHVRHCIVTSQYQWDYYASDYNKTYYIYNTNISKIDDLSTIGLTIQPSKKLINAACQNVRNDDIGRKFHSILKEWEEKYDLSVDIFDDVLKPMSDEDVKRRERAKVANREIIKKDLSIEEIKQYVTEDGADINKNNGVALINAVESGEYEKIKLCLELGASPNMQTGTNSAISKAKDFETIKLLVSYGSEISNNVINNVIDDAEALKYLFDAGLDPNAKFNSPIRTAIKGNYVNPEGGEIEPGEAYIDSVKLILEQPSFKIDEKVLRWAFDFARFDVLDLFKEKGIFDKLSEKTKVSIRDTWLLNSQRRKPEIIQQSIDYLNSL